MMIPPPRPADDPRNAPVYLRKTLLANGHDDRSIRRLVAEGVLVKVRRGAYTERANHDQLDAAGRHGLRARAVYQQARTAVVLSHVSGLPEYDAPTWGLDLSDVHVTRPDEKAGRHEAGVQQHCGRFRTGDTVLRHGMQVTTPTRLALEVTSVASAEAGLVVVNHFLHCGLTSKEELLDQYAVMERWPNTLRTGSRSASRRRVASSRSARAAPSTSSWVPGCLRPSHSIRSTTRRAVSSTKSTSRGPTSASSSSSTAR